MQRCIDSVLVLKDYFKDTKSQAEIPIPDDLVVGSNEWVYFVMYSCLLNYGVKTKLYNEYILKTYLSKKELFSPQKVLEKNRDELLIILKENIHPRYPNIAVLKWIKLSNELVKYDNITNTFNSYNNYKELYDFISKMGYGQKTGGLLLRIICDNKICCFDDSLPFIPLDRHDMEISYLLGITKKINLNKKEIEELSDLWVSSAKKCDLSASLIDKYLWEIGSIFCNKKKCLECPLNKLCRKKI